MTFKTNPSVVCTEVEDTMVLLHLDTKRYFTLNATGVSIWRELAAGKSEAEIVAALAAEYEAEASKLADSTHQLLGKLEQAGLILSQ
jgi:Coenzyme PQQ synthesis protein D (PqqD)